MFDYKIQYKKQSSLTIQTSDTKLLSLTHKITHKQQLTYTNLYIRRQIKQSKLKISTSYSPVILICSSGKQNFPSTTSSMTLYKKSDI